MNHHLKKSIVLASAMGLLSACGGGSSTDTPDTTSGNVARGGEITAPSTTETPVPTVETETPDNRQAARKGVSEGVIVKKDNNSVTINGTKFNIDRAKISSNGKQGNQEDLDVGKQVRVEADFDSNGEASATSVSYESELVGPITSIDTEKKHLVVLGQNIKIESDTVFDDSSFADLKVGQVIDVSGMINTDGVLEAGYIAVLNQEDEDDVEYILSGKIADLDTSAMTFTINTLHVDYSQASDLEELNNSLENGSVIYVSGSLMETGDTPLFQATEIYGEDDLADDEGFLIDIPGFITKPLENNQFEIEGLKINIDDDTVFIAGDASLLVLDAYVEVEGVIENGMIDAEYLMVEPDNEVEIFAPIESIDLANKTLTVLGNTFHIDERTLIMSYDMMNEDSDEESDGHSDEDMNRDDETEDDDEGNSESNREDDDADDNSEDDFSDDLLDILDECGLDYDDIDHEEFERDFWSGEELPEDLISMGSEDSDVTSSDDELNNDEDGSDDLSEDDSFCEFFEDFDDFEIDDYDDQQFSLTLEDLNVGDYVEVVSYMSAESKLIATFVARLNADDQREIFLGGQVENVNQENKTISLLGQTLDLGAGGIELYHFELECFFDECEMSEDDDESDSDNNVEDMEEPIDDSTDLISIDDFFSHVKQGDYLFAEGENNGGTITWRAVGIE